jgi:hypothetical protein
MASVCALSQRSRESGKGWPCSFRRASLRALFQNYSTAAEQVHRAAYASAILATPLLTFYLMVIPAVEELLARLVFGWKTPTLMMTAPFGIKMDPCSSLLRIDVIRFAEI